MIAKQYAKQIEDKIKNEWHQESVIEFFKCIYYSFYHSCHEIINSYDDCPFRSFDECMGYIYTIAINDVKNLKFHKLTRKWYIYHMIRLLKFHLFNYVRSRNFHINYVNSISIDSFSENSQKKILENYSDCFFEKHQLDTLHFEQILNKIKPIQRKILLLKIKGYKFQEISKKLRKSLNFVTNEFYSIKNNQAVCKIYNDWFNIL